MPRAFLQVTIHGDHKSVIGGVFQPRGFEGRNGWCAFLTLEDQFAR
jgi:hypothetical protein